MNSYNQVAGSAGIPMKDTSSDATPMQRAMDRLGRNAGHLDGSLSFLSDRLDPVLTPSVPVSSKSAAGEQLKVAEAQLVENINHRADQLESMNTVVLGLIDRLSL